MADDDIAIFDDIVFTPGTTMIDEVENRERHASLIRSSLTFPSPGRTYIIREVDNNRVLSLYGGNICLVSSDTLGASIHWECKESRGWLGFKNLASGQLYLRLRSVWGRVFSANRFLGKFLGFNTDRSLRVASHHQGWESFCVRTVPQGFVLLMLGDHEKVEPALWPVVRKEFDNGVQLLEKVKAPAGDGIAWEFEEVQRGIRSST